MVCTIGFNLHRTSVNNETKSVCDNFKDFAIRWSVTMYMQVVCV